MITNVWFYLVSILKALFTTPEYTKLEQELIRRCEHLETELHEERQRYGELAKGLLPASRIVPPSVSNPTPLPGMPSWDSRRKELETKSYDRQQQRIRDLESEVKRREASIAADPKSPELDILTSSDDS